MLPGHLSSDKSSGPGRFGVRNIVKSITRLRFVGSNHSLRREDRSEDQGTAENSRLLMGT